MDSITLQQSIKHPFNLLKFTFVIVPIVAGLDKFTNLLTDWTQYINPAFLEMLPFSGSTFMMIVGIIEIIAGVIVLIKTELGGYIVAAWLTLIALTLLGEFNFIDVAVRDFVMAIPAFSMGSFAKFIS